MFLFFCFLFLFWHVYQGLTKDVSSVVGAPWRCGVLTQGGTAGIGLGRLLGREHASTPQIVLLLLLFELWLFVVRCSLFVVRCLLFVVCCLLFVVCCLLFVVCLGRCLMTVHGHMTSAMQSVTELITCVRAHPTSSLPPATWGS